jgi:hypothetical protein
MSWIGGLLPNGKKCQRKQILQQEAISREQLSKAMLTGLYAEAN